MTAPFSNNQLSPVFPDNASVRDADAAGTAPRRGRGFADQVASVFSALRSFAARDGVINELNRLSDRELADIGLNRTDIPRVFDPAFAAEHAHRG